MRLGKNVVNGIYGSALQHPLGTARGLLHSPIEHVAKETWNVLGPFQIGTREAPWGADPLEYHGGFRALEHDPLASYKSSLGLNGTVKWSNHTVRLVVQNNDIAVARLGVRFPDIDWDFHRQVYGWLSTQWQAWARGEIEIHGDSYQTIILHTEGIIEFWVDNVLYFGGDFYGYQRAPVVLNLLPGRHRLDVRLIRDVRSMGGIEEPMLDVQIRLERSPGGLRPSSHAENGVLISDVVGGEFGLLASPYASAIVRNDGQQDLHVHNVTIQEGCSAQLLVQSPLKLVSGQTRPIPFQLHCSAFTERIRLMFWYAIAGSETCHALSLSVRPRILATTQEVQKVTFMHPGGMLSYAMLRPPLASAQCGDDATHSLPVMIVLHGAGVEADSELSRHALDTPGLCAWVLFPSGGSSWSGDDWHTWGLADVEAAVAMIPTWIATAQWQGPRVNTERWLVSGHSNGGQGVWYMLTHRPDKVFAAVAASGYASIQTYVPFAFRHSADSAKEAIVQASLNDYRHELLLENAKGIPVVQQHGSRDENVPAYHSRLMNQRMMEAGAENVYFEIPGRPHWWPGVLTTTPLRHFYEEQLGVGNSTLDTRARVAQLGSFNMVVANPGSMGSKMGLQVRKLLIPGQLGRLKFDFEPHTGTCAISCSNILEFLLPLIFNECQLISIDGKEVTLPANPEPGYEMMRDSGIWRLKGKRVAQYPFLFRSGRQSGSIDAILRTRGRFSIVRHSRTTTPVALQVSRNLCQYFSADSDITDDYNAAFRAPGNIISVFIGSDVPSLATPDFPITVTPRQVVIRDGILSHTYSAERGGGLSAIFLRPLPNERLELVVWGSDASSLQTAARLIPTLTGAGLPDFVIADSRLRWRSIDGALALGFFDTHWNVSRNSYLT